MPDYQQGKIYKLWSPSKNLVYYGSTVQSLAVRLGGHLADFNRYNNKISIRYVNSFKILECEDYKIELVEEYPCNNRQQLCKKEGEYIKANKCINKCVAGRTDKEYYFDNIERKKDYDANYRDANADKIKQYNKEYREKQKELKKEKIENL